MTRPRKKVRGENVTEVISYLQRLMKDQHRWGRIFGKIYSRAAEARKELRDFSPYGTEPNQVQAWCDEYLEQEDFRRMWAALRKKRHAKRHDTRNVTLPKETYDALSDYAEREGVTIAEAVQELLSLVDEKDVTV